VKYCLHEARMESVGVFVREGRKILLISVR